MRKRWPPDFDSRGIFVIDERILQALRRMSSTWDRTKLEATYATVLDAYSNSLTKEVIITGTSFDGEQTNAQVVLNRAAMADWLDTLEARLAELDAVAQGLGPLVSSAPVMDFSKRYVGT